MLNMCVCVWNRAENPKEVNSASLFRNEQWNRPADFWKKAVSDVRLSHQMSVTRCP